MDVQPEKALYRGEGRGPITRDGCAVELYREMPYRDELAIFGRLLAPRCSILELGCGTGRITHALLAAGHDVTAVDNAAEMLRHVPAEATNVLSNIEDLELGRRFDVVLLASCLINTPVDSVRRAQLSACLRHLAPGGRLIFERFDPDWLRSAAAGPLGRVGPVAAALERVTRDDELVSMTLCYSTLAEEWRQHFTAIVLDADDVERALTEVGFRAVEWIDARWGWATPSPPPA